MAMLRVRLIRPAFAALYGSLAKNARPLTDAMLTITPPPRSIIPGSTAFEQRNADFRLSGDVSVPRLLVDLEHVVGHAAARVVDEHVDAVDCRDHPCHVRGDGDVGLHRGAADRLRDLLRPLADDVGDEDRRAVGREAPGRSRGRFRTRRR